jgi:hypothetical protein
LDTLYPKMLRESSGCMSAFNLFFYFNCFWCSQIVLMSWYQKQFLKNKKKILFWCIFKQKNTLKNNCCHISKHSFWNLTSWIFNPKFNTWGKSPSRRPFPVSITWEHPCSWECMHWDKLTISMGGMNPIYSHYFLKIHRLKEKLQCI